VPVIPSPLPDQVQIIRFENDGGDGIQIYLEKDTFKSILAKAGDRPAVIFSITGPTQRGKSLFLNFALQFLPSIAEKSHNDASSQMENRFDWRKGHRTSGILL
jgi:hypothetical protein